MNRGVVRYYRQRAKHDIIASRILRTVTGIAFNDGLSFRSRLVLVALFFLGSAPAFAVDIAPHRALYSLSLASSKTAGGAGVIGASGGMIYEWGETCDGWTVQQRFRLRLEYAEQENVEMSSTLVTWESKDGLRYRFNERRLKNGDLDEEIKGEAKLAGKGKGGVAEFIKPEATTLTLPEGTLFPTAHTLVLIDRAEGGDEFVSRKVFDGAEVENSGQITAVIGPALKPDAGAKDGNLPEEPAA